MDKIERIKKQFEQGNRWVEGNTDDIKQALRELGYRLSPKSEELPTLKDVFPAGGVPDEWAKAIEYYRAYLIGCGITQAKRLPSDKRESVAKKLAMIHLGKDWEDLDEEERALYLGDADEVIPLISSPMEVLSVEDNEDLFHEVAELFCRNCPAVDACTHSDLCICDNTDDIKEAIIKVSQATVDKAQLDRQKEV